MIWNMELSLEISGNGVIYNMLRHGIPDSGIRNDVAGQHQL